MYYPQGILRKRHLCVENKFFFFKNKVGGAFPFFFVYTFLEKAWSVDG
jgi:hypothetical protein